MDYEVEDKDYQGKLQNLESGWSDTYTSVRSDLEFLSGGKGMWEQDVYNARSDDDRPVCSIPLLNPFVDTIVAPCRLTPPNIAVNAQDEKVERLANGIIRGIEAASSSSESYSGALQNAVGAGLGWLYLEIVTEKGLNELRIKHSHDPLAIMIDPLSTRVDGADAQYACYRGYISKDLANRTYENIEDGMSEKGTSTSTFFNVPDNSYPDVIWYCLTSNGMDITRTIGSTEVYSQSFPGVDKLPVVPVIGEQLYAGSSNIRLGGLVRRGRAINESFNVTYSNMLEMVALAPKSPYIGSHDAFKKNLDVWGTANSKSHSFIGYDHVDKDGNPIPMPQRADNTAQTQGLQNLATWMYDLQNRAIGMNDVQMGGLQTAQESGKSLIARMEAADAGSKGKYMDHLTLSITQLAKTLIQLIPIVYAGERSISVIDENGNASSVTGDVRTVLTKEVIDYLDVQIESGPQKEGLRKAAGGVLETLISTAGPDKGVLLMDLWLDTQEIPNKDSVKARLQKMIPAEYLEDTNPDEDPAAVAALEQASAMIDEKDQAIQWMETEIAKLQQQVFANDTLAKVELRKAEISAQTKLQTTQMDNQTKRELEGLKQGSEDQRTAAKLTADQEKQIRDIIADINKQNKNLEAKATEELIELAPVVDVPQFVADDLTQTNIEETL